MDAKSKNTSLLRGQTIELSQVTKEDLDFICTIESDVALWHYEESVETDKERIRKKFTDNIERKDAFDFIVRRVSDGVRVGIVYIWGYVDWRKSWEIGFVILPEFQGRGYCFESVSLLLSFAFKELDAHKVIGMCNCENQKSEQLMTKLGMTKEGVFREEYRWQGKWVDQFYYCILDREFSSLK